MSNIPNKFIFFDLDGNYLRDIPCKDYYYSIGNYENEFILFKQYSTNNRDHRVFLNANLNKETNKKFLTLRDSPASKMLIDHPIIVQSSSSLFCSSFLDNTIYTIDEGDVKPKYYVDFGYRSMQFDFFDKSFNESISLKDLYKSEKLFYPSSIRETDNYVYFRFEPSFKCIVSTSTNSIEYSKLLRDTVNQIFIVDYIAHDGVNDHIIFQTEPKNLKSSSLFAKDMLTHKQFSESIWPKLDSINLSDNPILLIYTLK